MDLIADKLDALLKKYEKSAQGERAKDILRTTLNCLHEFYQVAKEEEQQKMMGLYAKDKNIATFKEILDTFH